MDFQKDPRFDLEQRAHELLPERAIKAQHAELVYGAKAGGARRGTLALWRLLVQIFRQRPR